MIFLLVSPFLNKLQLGFHLYLCFQFEGDKIENIQGVTECKLTWPDDTKLEEEALNIDGDIYFLKDTTVHCKYVYIYISPLFGEVWVNI